MLRASASTRVWVGAKKRDSKSNKETGMEEVESGVKYMLDFKSPIQGLLGVHSRCGLHTRTVTKSRPLSRGFRHFVTSMPAPVASGWSGCRVGLAPTGKRRLARRTQPPIPTFADRGYLNYFGPS